MKTLQTTLILLTLAAMTVACGQDRELDDTVTIRVPEPPITVEAEQGEQGPQGEQGEQGPAGEDALAEAQELTITASRDYDPSVFNPTSETVGAAVIQLPEALPMTGSAGTGWASITLNDVKFCYQGDGKNNSDIGTQFDFVGVTDAADECFAGTSSGELLFIEYFDDVDITVAVHGGGVSSGIRTLTEVEATIQLREFN